MNLRYTLLSLRVKCASLRRDQLEGCCVCWFSEATSAAAQQSSANEATHEPEREEAGEKGLTLP